ncbi:MAG: hypothetical protein LLF94_04805 [Chlamydiales bacterium]|nr:hypothetical protein [Chlamydiales bacterium]
MNNANNKNVTLKVEYHYSYFWLIFWVIFFFPVALVLLLTGISFPLKGTMYSVSYKGSRFWLGFWTIVFFPIMFILLFLNGLTVHASDMSCINCTPKE